MPSEIISVLMTLTDNISGGLDNITKKTDSFASKAKNLSSAFAPISLAAGAALGASAKVTIDFQDALNEASKALNLTADGVEKFKTKAFELQKTLKYQLGATEIASLAAEAGKLGVAEKDLGGYVEGLVKLGVATSNMKNIDTLNTSVAKTNSVFKMGIPELQDYYAAVNRLSDSTAANANEIMEFNMRVAGTAKTAGISANAISAWGASLIGAGVDVSSAEGFIRNFTTTLSATGTWSKKQRKAFDGLGISAEFIGKKFSVDANGAMLEVMDTLKKLQGTDPVKFNNTMAQIFGREWVGKGKLAISALDSLRTNLDLVGQSAENAKRFEAEFTKQSETVTGKLETIKNQLVTLGIQLGSVILPVIADILSYLSPLVEKVIQLAQQHPGITKLVVAALGIVAIVSPLLALVGAIASGITALSTLAPLLAGVAGIITTIGGVIFGLPGLIALAIAGVAALGYAVYKNWGGIANWTDFNVIQPLMNSWRSFTNWLPGLLENIVNNVVMSANNMFNAYLNFFGVTRDTWNKFVDSLGLIIQRLFQMWVRWQNWQLSTVSGWASSVWSAMKPLFNFIGSTISKLYNDIVTTLARIPGAFVQIMSPIASALSSLSKVIWDNTVGVLWNVTKEIYGMLNRLVADAWSFGTGFVSALVNGIRSKIGSATSAVAEMTSNIAQYLPHSDAKKGELSRLTASGIAFANTFINAINGTIGNRLNNLVTPGDMAFAGNGGNNIAPPFQGNSGNSGSMVTFSPTYNITARDSEDILKQIKQRDREILDFLNKSSGRLNRRQY